jgi:hypothetical protein
MLPLSHFCDSACSGGCPDILTTGETVKLSSLGVLTVRTEGKRIGRNPTINVEVPVKPRRIPTFRASPVLNASINGGQQRRSSAHARRQSARAVYTSAEWDVRHCERRL